MSLVGKGPIKVSNFSFPKDQNSRRLILLTICKTYQMEKTNEKKWLICSIHGVEVFCFCCKLFYVNSSKSNLATIGTNDWKWLTFYIVY